MALLLGASFPLSAAELSTALRRPVALAQSSDGNHLYVANRETGTVSLIDLAAKQVVAEQRVGERLADLVAIPGTTKLLAADEAAHELLLLEVRGETLEVIQRLPVSPYPVSILLADDGSHATVASLWSRRLTFIDLGGCGSRSEPQAGVAVERPSPGRVLKITSVLDLPFAPRCQLSLPNRNRLLVADSFGGKLAILEPSSRRLLTTLSLPAHNIRGLGVSPNGQMLVVAHQMLNDLAQSIRNDIHWGLLMSNDLRWLAIDSVLAGGKQLYRGAHMHPLGDAGKGGGDPGGLDIAPDGTVVVAISGVNEVAFGKEGDFSMQRIRVQDCPTAVRIARGGGQAFIANTLADSISILDLHEQKITATISLGPSPELTVAQRGELLFHDARLSHDGWMSCQSCHTDGHTSGQMNDNFSDRSFGAAKRVLSLLGVKDTLPLAWNGQVQSLEQQIHNSIFSTMQREESFPDARVDAIAAYLQTLELPPPLDSLRGTRDLAAVERGRLIFDRHDCARCHAPPTYTSPATYDVGLRDSQGAKEFNPPSLRGLSHRGPYFHDNSAASLEDVFLLHGHPSESPYQTAEVRDLVAFLMSL